MSNKNVKIILVFTDVFEFSSDSKKTSDFQFTDVLLLGLNVFSSRVRSKGFYVMFRIVKKHF